MSPEIAKLLERCDPLLARYEKWQQPLHRYWSENLPRVNRDGYTLERFKRGSHELEESLKAEYNPYPELYSLMDGVCSLFLGCTSEDRTAIRAFVAQRAKLVVLFRRFADHLAAGMNGPQDAAILRIALAAISIENCGSDYRDTLTSLADLYVRAEEVGIEPNPVFEATAELSTDARTRGRCESLARMLREFESYAVVSERRRMGRPYRQSP
jgi:hypothetical protein